MGRRSRYTVRPFRDGDGAGLLALHNRAFEGHPVRSTAHWRWKFLENPLRCTEIVLAEDDAGTCVAVYATVPHRCVLAGEECRGVLHMDVAVDPSLRTGLGGSRVLVELGRAYSAHFLVPETRIEWAFPEPALQRVTTSFMRAGVLRDLLFLVRAVPGADTTVPAGLRVETVERLGADVDRLWERCRAEVGTAVVRDATYLNWRYADHPDHRHGLLEARDSAGDLRGVAVWRRGGGHPDVVSIMDWLVPVDDEEAEQALLARTTGEARREGVDHLVAWFPAPSPRFLRFQRRHGFHVVSTPFQEVYRSWGPGLGRRWLDEHWYQTLGDVDFF